MARFHGRVFLLLVVPWQEVWEFFNDHRLTAAKEVLQKDMKLKHLELKHGLEKLTEQVREFDSQPRKK